MGNVIGLVNEKKVLRLSREFPGNVVNGISVYGLVKKIFEFIVNVLPLLILFLLPGSQTHIILIVIP